MLPLAAIVIALAAAALCWRRQRRAAAWRAGLLARCAAEIEAPRLGRDRAGYATLRGRSEGAAIDVRLIPDTLVHRRLPLRWTPKRGYLKRLVQAHRLHHATRGRDGAVSFGFLYAPPVRKLKARLQGREDGR